VNSKYFAAEPKISRRSLRNWATRTSKSTENLFRLFYGFTLSKSRIASM
jgi:hypothetical protein